MKHTLGLVAGSALLLMLAGCGAPAGDHATGQAGVPPELQLYNVPPAQTGRLAQALGNALGGKATVSSPASGKLLVYAPHATQASIAAAITSLGKSSPSEQASAQARLHFWIVDGVAGPGTDDPALKPLATTLDSVRQAMGPLHFRLNQSLEAMASARHAGSIVAATDGGYLRSFDFKIDAANGDALDLWLGYEDHGQSGLARFNTEINAQSGHYVVLAQAPGACAPALPGKSAPPCPEKPMLRLLIVRADRLPPNA